MKDAKRFSPFILTVLIVTLDQLTKLLVIRNIPLDTIRYRLLGDFLYICHVRNTGAAFSIGAGNSDFFRILVFIALPMALMLFICHLVVSGRSPLSSCQRWLCAGIAGGGIGTLIDRIVRFDSGVVDFISVKFYGLFGLDRWPTFNVSDSAVVIFVALFAFSVLFSGKGDGEKGGR